MRYQAKSDLRFNYEGNVSVVRQESPEKYDWLAAIAIAITARNDYRPDSTVFS